MRREPHLLLQASLRPTRRSGERERRCRRLPPRLRPPRRRDSHSLLLLRLPRLLLRLLLRLAQRLLCPERRLPCRPRLGLQ